MIVKAKKPIINGLINKYPFRFCFNVLVLNIEPLLIDGNHLLKIKGLSLVLTDHQNMKLGQPFSILNLIDSETIYYPLAV